MILKLDLIRLNLCKDIAAVDNATRLHVITVAEIVANVRGKESQKAAKSERLGLESEEVER